MNPAAAPNPIMSLVPIAAIFLIFYFLIIRPQQKQAQEHEKLLERLQKGDRIVTTGGLIGVITGFKGADLEVKIAENVKVTILRSAVSRLVGETTPAAASAPERAGAAA